LVSSKNIGVLGATGLIAQELISDLVIQGYKVTKFSRVRSSGLGLHSYDDLREHKDLGALVNLVGGHYVNADIAKLDQVDAIDALACEWSQVFGRPYVYISSGAVFGKNQIGPVTVDSPLGPEGSMDSYAKGKLHAERRHSELRSKGARVSDVRMFSYAGPRFVKDGRYFLSSAFKAAKDKDVFYSSGSEFVRDYIGARELSSAISNTLQLEEGIKFNLFSKEAATRKQILDVFQSKLDLNFVWNPEDELEYYCSDASNSLPNYTPRASIDVITASILQAKELMVS
jgi:nucleoside-diphosphate-sugar epimerase